MAYSKQDMHVFEMQVRDYELDLQGIVNNAVYFNYLEHARHAYLIDRGIDFEGLFKDGIAAMVIKAELNYKQSLSSHDVFQVETFTSKKGRFKILFHQIIRKLNDEKPCIEAVITTACIDIKSKKPVEKDW